MKFFLLCKRPSLPSNLGKDVLVKLLGQCVVMAKRSKGMKWSDMVRPAQPSGCRKLGREPWILKY